MKIFLTTIFYMLLGAQLNAQAEMVENKGQWPAQVQFRAALPTGALWLESGGFTWQFFDPSILKFLHPVGSTPGEASSIYREHSYRVSMVNAQPVLPVGKKK
ncbi:MAG: hypothetical protein ACKVOR_09735, partial [Flavobacteriales bacterium]